EEHVARLEIGEQRGEIAGAGDDGAGCCAEADTEFARDDLAERRLAEAGRAEQQNVVHRFAALASGFDENFEIGLGRGLADEFVKPLRTQCAVRALSRQAFRRGDAFCVLGHGAFLPWIRDSLANGCCRRASTNGRWRRGWRGSYPAQGIRVWIE